MLTQLTQMTRTTTAILYDIADGGTPKRSERYGVSIVSIMILVLKLESKGIIRLKNELRKEQLSSYELTSPMSQITLLEILEAIDEEIDPSCVILEKMYEHANNETSWKNTIDRIARAYLEEIKLTDLQDVWLVD